MCSSDLLHTVVQGGEQGVRGDHRPIAGGTPTDTAGGHDLEGSGDEDVEGVIVEMTEPGGGGGIDTCGTTEQGLQARGTGVDPQGLDEH